MAQKITREELEKRIKELEKEVNEKNKLIDSYNQEKNSRSSSNALQECEHYFRSILATTQDGFGMFTEKGQITEVNEAICQMLGYDRKELLSKNITDLIINESTTITSSRLLNVRSGKAETYESVHRRKDGSFFNVEISLNYSNEFGGQFFCFCRDISERKRAEEEKQKLEIQLRHSRKMDAIGQLVGGVSHNFNNILQVIFGYSEIIMDKYPDLDSLQQDMQQLIKVSQKARDLVRQLLLFSRHETSQPQKFSLNEIINNLMKMIKQIIGEQIQIEINLDLGLNEIYADIGQIEQVIMNLCINARDAMPNGGKITIETLNSIITQEFCNRYPFAKEGEYVLLSISDNGCGISDGLREHIFEPFFTTKEIGKGTGLGLATCYGIIKTHQGFILFDSEVGKGTTFKVYLPVVQKKIIFAETEQQQPKLSSKKETILYAEDEKEVRNMLSKIMRNAGYKIIEASNGKEAIRLFEEHKEEIEMAMLDLVMPEISGERVLQKIKQLRPELPVLFCSGYGEELLDDRIFKDNHYQMIYKPLLSKALLTKIREMLDA